MNKLKAYALKIAIARIEDVDKDAHACARGGWDIRNAEYYNAIDFANEIDGGNRKAIQIANSFDDGIPKNNAEIANEINAANEGYIAL